MDSTPVYVELYIIVFETPPDKRNDNATVAANAAVTAAGYQAPTKWRHTQFYKLGHDLAYVHPMLDRTMCASLATKLVKHMTKQEEQVQWFSTQYPDEKVPVDDERRFHCCGWESISEDWTF